MRQSTSIENLFQDIRYGLRLLARRPALTAVAIITLAFGIGANTTIFSLVNGILLRPIPYPEPDRLVRLTESYPKGAFVILRDQCQTMDVAAIWPGEELNIAESGRSSIRVNGAMTSANLFSVLGARPEHGRIFYAGEDIPGNDRVIILSHILWQKQFGGDPNIVGRLITLEGEERQVIGVMSSDFRYPAAETRFWIPLSLNPQIPNEFWGPEMPLIARLRPSANAEQAQQEIRTLIPVILSSSPFPKPANWNDNSTIVSLQQSMVGDVRPELLILQCAVGLVLLMTCSNVANLLLARAATRRKEIAIRVALGAGRWRIVRQLLTESVVLALGGGALGILFATEGLTLLKALLPADTPRLAEAAVDWRVLIFTAVLATLTGLIFGLAPALNSLKVDLTTSLNASGRRSSGGGTGRLHNALVVIEIGLAVILVTGAGLLIKSLWLLSRTDPGFRSENIFMIQVTPDKGFCKERARCLAFYDELLRRMKSLQGVDSVAGINSLPLSEGFPVLPLAVEGYNPGEANAQAPLVWAGAITSGYTQVMDIPILTGRAFNNDDRIDTAGVVMVTASTAKHFWPGQDAIGKRIKPVWDKEWRTVVGVVADVKQYGLASNRPDFLSGEIYMPYTQAVAGRRQFPTSLAIVLRTSSDQLMAPEELRQMVASLNADVPVSDVQKMKAVVSESISTPNSTTWLFIIFAALALTLGAVGIYSLISYSVAERTHEIGVRMALGATSKDVLKLVIGQAMALNSIGIGLGIAASVGLMRFLVSQLYGVKPIDPAIFVIVPLVLSCVALLASYIPARRASKVNPLEALRFE